tara:strand:- start:44437 stop:44550 length:114 start_codon:yes stop_codon:yes gene_type:complete
MVNQNLIRENEAKKKAFPSGGKAKKMLFKVSLFINGI